MAENLQPVLETLQSGMITQAKKVDELEEKLKAYFNYPYVLTVNSATSGLSLAARLVNDRKQAMLCTPLTCMATTCAVLENRMPIKWVDVDKKTCNMDLEDLKEKSGYRPERTLGPQGSGRGAGIYAILAVHWGGSPLDIDKLYEIAEETGSPVIEDCAHSFGSKYKGKHLGTFGKSIAVYSLQAIKHFTSGDGGVMLLPNKEMYERAKLLRWFGISREKHLPAAGNTTDSRLEEDIKEWGYKYHMNDINASIALCNFPYVNDIVDKHNANAQYYRKRFVNMKNVKLLDETPDSFSAFWIFTIKVQNKQKFLEFMKEKNIMVSQVHKRNDGHSCVSAYKMPLPNMDELEKSIISIPVGWWLSEDEREYIANCVEKYDNDLQNDMMEIQEQETLTISELRREDRDEYLALLFELNNVVCSTIKFDSVFTSLPMSGSRIFVFRRNGKIVSSLKLIIEKKFFNDVAHIEDVVTLASERKRGYATTLIKHAVEVAKKAGCYKVVLQSLEKNRKFYEKLGFGGSCGFSLRF